jgi:hypothetical protein
MLIGGLIGLVAAWLLNHYQYGGVARFGPFSTENELTAAAVVDQIESREWRAPAGGSPRAAVSGEAVHDFGVMRAGSAGEHQFVIANRGDAELQLRLGESTCKCTLGELERDTVPAGQSTQITLKWTVKPEDSSFAQSARILTNDPTQPTLDFGITGTVVRGLDVVPPIWNFGNVTAGEPFQLAGTIYSFMEHDVTVGEITFSHPQLTESAEFEVQPLTPTPEADGSRSSARQAFRVTATLNDSVPQGIYACRLLIVFHAAESKPIEVSIPIDGQISGPLSMILNQNLREVAGSYLYDWGKIRENDPLSTTLFVVLKGDQRENASLRIGEVSPAEAVTATLGAAKGRGSMKLFPLQIQLIPGAESVERNGMGKDDYGSVWIESDNPKVPKLRVALKFSMDGR